MPESNEVGDQQEYIDRNEVKQLREVASMLPEGTPMPSSFVEPREEGNEIISALTNPTATVESRSGYLVEESDLDDLVRRLKLEPWQKQRIASWSNRLRQFHTGEPESEILSAEPEFDRNESRWLGEVPPGGQIVRPEPESLTSE